jgi:hypothetical protein
MVEWLHKIQVFVTNYKVIKMKNLRIVKTVTLVAYLFIFFTSHNISIPYFFAIIDIATNIDTLLRSRDIISIVVLTGIVFWIFSIFKNHNELDKIILILAFVLLIVPIVQFSNDLIFGKESIGTIGLVLFVVPSSIFTFLSFILFINMFNGKFYNP